ncbi:MAG: DUF4433 domain-containing protein [Ignavibacteria bacterium]|nr:DUF4433 domain-containing protein [Ignavibacteria bacterium]
MNLYYFAHLNNFVSIVENGIYSKNEILSKRISFSDVSNTDVQNRRHYKKIIIKDKDYGYLHNYVPLYFTPAYTNFLQLH